MFPKRLLAIGLVAAVLAHGGLARAQWASMGGPNCAGILSMIARGDTVLAGVNEEGLFRSTDGGLTWNRDTSKYFKQIPADPPYYM
ncbi:MAG: hypothetical protein ACHQNE_05290, partial [Candidatus Kapaibacterium sp.]